jgi:hypothetical protein
VYLPDSPISAYQNLLDALDHELTYTFGGCTILRGLDGRFLSRLGHRVLDRVSIIYTDAPFSFRDNFEIISRYTDELREAAFSALEEEAVLIVAFPVHHSA